MQESIVVDYRECGFCGRDIKVPLVRAEGMVFCCTSCFRAYQALHPSETAAVKKRKKTAATVKSRKITKSRKNKTAKKTKQKQHVRKQQQRQKRSR